MDLGILIIRVVVGLIFVGYGSQKLFGVLGGYGPKGTGGYFESIGIKPGVAMAVVAGLSELFGGAFLILGFLTALGSLLIVMTMIVAIAKVHGPKGFWLANGGYEYNLVLIAVAIGVGLIGAGSYSIDASIFGK